jgi:CMP-N-acetylneuraminic acid synthetase
MGKKIQKILCILPIRSGSKEIRNKNILNFNGKPLCINSLKIAEKSNLFDQIIIATDSEKYITLLKKYTSNKKVKFFLRSKKSSTNIAKTEIVINEVLKHNKEYDTTFLIQVTSPFIKKEDLILGLKKFNKDKLDSLFTGYETKKFFWKEKNKKVLSLNYNFKNRPMRQEQEKTIVENGAFYIFKNKFFNRYNNRLFRKIGSYIMPQDRSMEIDSLQDFRKAKKQLKS